MAKRKADAEIKTEVPPDTNPKYGKPGGEVRTFSILNNPDTDDAGVWRYTLFEVFVRESGRKVYEPIAQELTGDEADAFVEKNGQWDA